MDSFILRIIFGIDSNIMDSCFNLTIILDRISNSSQRKLKQIFFKFSKNALGWISLLKKCIYTISRKCQFEQESVFKEAQNIIISRRKLQERMASKKVDASHYSEFERKPTGKLKVSTHAHVMLVASQQPTIQGIVWVIGNYRAI